MRVGLPWLIFAGFFPAGLGLFSQIFQVPELSHRILATAILLMSVEQARMAVVDLQQIAALAQHTDDERLSTFRAVVLGTIGLELLGFYLAIAWLGWGAMVVLGSQIFFNLAARIQLETAQDDDPIQPCTWLSRLDVLGADVLGVLLVGLWVLKVVPVAIASGLLAIVILYIGVKYGKVIVA